ncbi:NAD(P)/FAD-dependent oxidoreductase [Rhodotorula paludigena]|uniref:NAD(P)/FAD-dependent oxidoreductase n=1 Tax=Rhodotorula paludigena TaxID=86838 RepID=UPI00317E165D
MAQAAQNKNVVVAGGSYVGLAVAKELVDSLPKDYTVSVLEQNSHFGHLFAYPRFAISPGSEHKAFVPYAHLDSSMLPSPHRVVRARAVALDPARRTVQLADGGELGYEALVVATGTKLSPPGTMPGGGDKKDGVEYLRSIQGKLKAADEIVIIGGGAVGVQMACDLAILYPAKRGHITLIQSRRLMPRFHPQLHDIVSKRFAELGVNTITGVRAEVPEGGYERLNEQGGGEIVLKDGRRIKADYVVHALGQTPNSQLVASSLPSAVNPSGFIRVLPSLVIAPTSSDESAQVQSRIYAVGDIADSGAPKAARPAMQHAAVVARNIAKVLSSSSDELETITNSPGAIHLTLGVVESIIFRNPRSDGVDEQGEPRWVGEPEVMWKDDGKEDMGIEGVWARRLPGLKATAEMYHL